MSDDLVGPAELEVGEIYVDEDGVAWAVVGRDGRGAAMLTAPPADAPDWHGVLLEADGGWYESDRYLGCVEGLEPLGRRAACRGCGGPLVVSPATDPANHGAGCPWLTMAVRAVARGIASPAGRWLRPPAPGELTELG